MRPTVYSSEPLGGWSATLPLPDYGRVARDPPGIGGLQTHCPRDLLPVVSQRKSGILPVGNQNGGAMKQKKDLLQGTLALMVLKTLDVLGPLHGYGIARRIEQISGVGRESRDSVSRAVEAGARRRGRLRLGCLTE